MAANAYYKAENERWPELDELEPTAMEVLRVVNWWASKELGDRALCGDFRVRFFAAKHGVSTAGRSEMNICSPSSWLTIAHEFAHLVDFRTRRVAKRRHDKVHRAIVDRLCTDLRKILTKTGRIKRSARI